MRNLGKLLLGLWMASIVPVQAAGTAVLLDIDGAISPATSDFIERSLDKAANAQARVFILRMNTPGGLDTAMRDIIQAILGSPVPVVTWVAPGGARAASAGTYILYASHVAAMAPGTNLGAATPVQLGGGGLPRPNLPGADKKENEGSQGEDLDNAMEHKLVNDAVAYLRSLAQLRNRNQEWAEKAVREGASLPAEEALEAGVIDLMAQDLPELLAAVNGRVVSVKGQELVLGTEDLDITVIEPDWRTRLLSVIADPNVAYILIIIGLYGLIFEFYSPGFLLPGVVGAICLLLALFALQVLPVNYAGLALLILGVIFMVTEAFMPSFGVLGIGGIIAFMVGSIILIDTDVPGYGVSIPLIVTFSVISGVFFLGIVGLAIKARQRPVVSGQEELIGALGTVVRDFDVEGRIQIHGESWQARADTPLKSGQRVCVTGLDGLVLHVEPQKEE